MFHAAVRAAAAELLRDYADSVSLKLQVYEGRPQSIFAPCAFVDRISEAFAHPGDALIQRTPRVSVIVLHGRFDGKDTATQKDAFVDGFVDWCATRYHAAGANTLMALVATEDQPAYVPEWMAPDKQLTYYATEIVLEGWAQS